MLDSGGPNILDCLMSLMLDSGGPDGIDCLWSLMLDQVVLMV